MQLKIVYHVRNEHSDRFGVAMPPDADLRCPGRQVGYIYHVTFYGSYRPWWADDGGPDENGWCFHPAEETYPINSRAWRDYPPWRKLLSLRSHPFPSWRIRRLQRRARRAKSLARRP